MWDMSEQQQVERAELGTAGPGAGQQPGAGAGQGAQAPLAPRPFLQQLHAGMDDMISMMGKIQKLYGGFKQMEPIIRWVAGGLEAGKATTSAGRKRKLQANASRQRRTRRK
jgi:hypothetical protein